MLIKKEIKNNEEYYEGVLTACDPNRSGNPEIDARGHVNIAENWLNSNKNDKFVPWGHNKKSNESKGHLFLHQKGETVIIALLEYENILTKDDVEENMLPPEWRNEKWQYFYKVIKVICTKIPRNMLKNRRGKQLPQVGGMNELARVRVKKIFVSSNNN